jgi:4-amino-4-deoxy-L-arabinose transferase-like glycosyltransferase
VTASGLPSTRAGRCALGLGLSAAVLLYLALTLPRVFAMHPFLPDESAHVAYALQVSGGHLPALGEPVARTLPGQPPSPQYVANHPPLYHVLAGAVMRAVDPDRALLAGRLFTALLTIGTVLLAGLLALSLRVRHGPQLAVGTAAVVASFPPLSQASAGMANDSLLALCGTAALTALVRILRIGPTPARYAALSAACAAGMLTKVNMVVVVGVVVAALVASSAAATHSGPRRWRAAVDGTLLVLGVTALASGWFYLRLWSVYGDPLGGPVIYGLVAGRDREPSGTSVLAYLTDPLSWWNLWAQAFGGYYTRRAPDPAVTGPLAVAAAALVAAGVVLGVIRGIRSLRRRHRPPVRQLVVPAALGAALLGLVLLMAYHVTQLGSPQARYVAPAVAAYGVVVAATLGQLPGRRVGGAVFALVGLQTAGAVARATDTLREASGLGPMPDLTGLDWWRAFQRAVTAYGYPSELVPICVAAAAAALATIAVSLAVLGREGPEGPAPSQGQPRFDHHSRSAASASS